MSSTFAGPNDAPTRALREGQRFVIMDPFTPYERAVTEEEHAAITAYWPKPKPAPPLRITSIDARTGTVTVEGDYLSKAHG